MRNSIMFTSEVKDVTIILTTQTAFLMYHKSSRLIARILLEDLQTTRSENTRTTVTSITTHGTCNASKPSSQKSILKEKREEVMDLIILEDNRTKSNSKKNTLITTIPHSLVEEAKDFSNSRFNSSKCSNRLHENFNSCKPNLLTIQWLNVNSSPMTIYSEFTKSV